MKETLITWLERILIFDVFLIIIGFFWLAIALIGRSLGIPLGWEIWYKLWQPLFNPAIAVLFIGAILSWLGKKLATIFSSPQD
jgi:predicted permease